MISDVDMEDVGKGPSDVIPSSAPPPPPSTTNRASLAHILTDDDPDDVDDLEDTIEETNSDHGDPAEDNEDNDDDSEDEEDDDEDDDEDTGNDSEHSIADSTSKATIAIDQGASSSQVPIPVPVIVHPASTPPAPSLPLNPASPGTSATAAAATSSKPASTTGTKPRSTKPVKPRSPSPSPPPPALPLKTIRLEIKLGGPSNYEVDISRQAKETGQREPTPPPIHKKDVDSSESEEDNKVKSKEGAKDAKDAKDDKKPKKRKKKNVGAEYYDVSDPFIDDSELALDERTFFAQTKQQGFYVSSGEVALMKDTSPKKPKSKKGPLGLLNSEIKASGKKELHHEGTRDSPIALDEDSEKKNGLKNDEDGDEQTGQKRKRYLTVVEGGKKRKVVDIHSFHPELQAAIEKMKVDISQESWTNKGKFPPAMKPKLLDLAVLAIKLDEYDEYFFNLMPSLFPYNKFTMSKLIKRTVFSDHLTILHERQDILLTELADLAKSGFAKAEEEWEKSVVAWDKRQEKLRAEVAEASTNPDSAAPTRQTTEEMDVDHPPGEDGKDGKDKDHGQHPPGKKFRMTDRMKTIVWQLVLLSNECCRLENEKNTLEGSVIQVSEQGLRKVLYQKIVSAFPEGWMSSGQISRDVSAMKKKLEREALEHEV